MKLFITIALISFITPTWSQDSIQHKIIIDSILIQNSKKQLKRIKIKEGKGQILHHYNKKNKQLINIQIIVPPFIPGVIPWSHNYNFINGELVMIVKWNGYPLKHKKRRIATYYFKDGNLIYREEKGTEIQNIEVAKAEGLQLVHDAPGY